MHHTIHPSVSRASKPRFANIFLGGRLHCRKSESAQCFNKIEAKQFPQSQELSLLYAKFERKNSQEAIYTMLAGNTYSKQERMLILPLGMQKHQLAGLASEPESLAP